MKVVILAGGRGLRLEEETQYIPKPMIEIGGEPIISKIIKLYNHYNYNDFIICTGYKSEVIEEYFKKNKINDCKITCVNSKEDTPISKRILSIKHLLDEDYFLLSYGDTISNVNINKLVKQYFENNKLLTLTAVHPYSNYGILKLDGNEVTEFHEKEVDYNNWVNGGFMMASSKIMPMLEKNKNIEFGKFLELLAIQHNIGSYKHNGFWYAIDTKKDKKYMEKLIECDKKYWEDYDD